MQTRSEILHFIEKYKLKFSLDTGFLEVIIKPHYRFDLFGLDGKSRVVHIMQSVDVFSVMFSIKVLT